METALALGGVEGGGRATLKYMFRRIRRPVALVTAEMALEVEGAGWYWWVALIAGGCVQSGRGGAPVGRQKELTLRRTVRDSLRERGEDHAAVPSPSPARAPARQPGDGDTRR